MLQLINGFWTLNGQKFNNLNATDKLVFNLLFEDKRNKIITFALNEIEVKDFEILKIN